MKKTIIFVFKIIIAIILFKIVSRSIDWQKFSEIVYTRHGIQALSLSVCLIILQYVIAGSKLWYLSKNTQTAVSIGDAIRSQFMSNFITQFGFSFASGDFARVIYLYNRYHKLGDISVTILCDRITGFIALSTLYFIALIGIPNIVYNVDTLIGLYLLALICLILILGYCGLLFLGIKFRHKLLVPLEKFISQSKKIFTANKSALAITSISFIVCVMNVFIFAICGYIFGSELPFTSYFFVSIPAILISMIPISIAGWGVRESAFIMGFGLLGNNGELGLTISLTFGVASLLASLPGILFIGKESQKNSAQVTA